jgi:hypothetical protein
VPTVLRAYGSDFDVDALLAGCTLPVSAVKRRGQPLHPTRQTDGGRRHVRSGVHVTASDAAFSDFPRQIVEVTAFLLLKAEQVRRICGWPGVESVTLDFGIERRDVAVQCDLLPSELIRLAGTFGLGIEISQYWPSDGESDSSGHSSRS